MAFQKSWNEADVTADAIRLHREMVDREARACGDIEGAMRRIEATYGLDYWSQYVCRYKRRITTDFALRLRGAYLDMLERSVRRDLHALKTEQALGATDAELGSLLAEGEALLAKINARKAGVK